MIAAKTLLKQFRPEVLGLCASAAACTVVLVLLAFAVGDRPSSRADMGGLVAAAYAAATALPIVIALILGVALVGRDIERGTAALAWQMARSRRRWLASRWLLMAALVVLLAMVLGLAADALHGAMHPSRAPSFDLIDQRGAILAARSLAVFGLAVLVGAVSGRVLPALIIGGALSVVLIGGMNAVMSAWATGHSLVLSTEEVDTSRVTSTMFRDVSSGRLLTAAEVDSITPPPGSADDWAAINFIPVPFGVPAAAAADYTRTESALFLALAAVAAVSTMSMIEARTPD